MFESVFYKPLFLDLGKYELRSPAAYGILAGINICRVCENDFHIFKCRLKSSPPVILSSKFDLNRSEKKLNTKVNTEKIKQQIINN